MRSRDGYFSRYGFWQTTARRNTSRPGYTAWKGAEKKTSAVDSSTARRCGLRAGDLREKAGDRRVVKDRESQVSNEIFQVFAGYAVLYRR